MFKDMFLSMNLPYSVVRGEIFRLQILVFNYKSSETDVSVNIPVSDLILLMIKKHVWTVQVSNLQPLPAKTFKFSVPTWHKYVVPSLMMSWHLALVVLQQQTMSGTDRFFYL